MSGPIPGSRLVTEQETRAIVQMIGRVFGERFDQLAKRLDAIEAHLTEPLGSQSE